MEEDFLQLKLRERADAGLFRTLTEAAGIDFCSNDYLGISRNSLLQVSGTESYGSTGSRLISGNYAYLNSLENLIASFHDAPAALMFNSGYDANLGVLSCVPHRQDTVVFDQLSHASIRDGIRLGLARSYSFAHNDVNDLEDKLKTATGRAFVVTESIFSMDGDVAPLWDIVSLCKRYEAYLIVDEAHATGVAGARGEGIVQQLGLQADCFARIHTFGKALGCHGAVVLGSSTLRDYLINFSRPFIYTTALPPHAAFAIGQAYALFPGLTAERAHLGKLVSMFREKGRTLQLLNSNTSIQGVVISGNTAAKHAATSLRNAGLDVRAILHPTVPQHTERLRIVLHSFNSLAEVDRLTEHLHKFA